MNWKGVDLVCLLSLFKKTCCLWNCEYYRMFFEFGQDCSARIAGVGGGSLCGRRCMIFISNNEVYCQYMNLDLHFVV